MARFHVGEVQNAHACEAALRQAFRGTFAVEDGQLFWSPPPGLGGHTLERMQAFLAGYLIGQVVQSSQ